MAYLTLFLAMIFWGTSFAITKEVVVRLDPVYVMLIRLLVAGVFFILTWPLFKFHHAIKKLQKSDIKWISILVLSEPCFYFLFETYALKFTSASAAGVITGLFPLTISIGAWIFFREKSPVIFWVGCLLAVVGVVLLTIVSSADSFASNPILGNSLMIGAVMLGTTYTLMASRLARRIDPVFLTAVQAWAGSLFYLIFCFIPFGRIDDLHYSEVFSFGHWPREVSTQEYTRLIYLGLLVSVGSYGLFTWSIARIKATTVAILVNFIPVLAIVFATYHLGEKLTQLQWVSISLVLIGVLVGSIPKK